MLKMVEASMGFLPASMMTMAHWLEFTQTFEELGATVLRSGELDAGLKKNDSVCGEKRSWLSLPPGTYS